MTKWKKARWEFLLREWAVFYCGSPSYQSPRYQCSHMHLLLFSLRYTVVLYVRLQMFTCCAKVLNHPSFVYVLLGKWKTGAGTPGKGCYCVGSVFGIIVTGWNAFSFLFLEDIIDMMIYVRHIVIFSIFCRFCKKKWFLWQAASNKEAKDEISNWLFAKIVCLCANTRLVHSVSWVPIWVMHRSGLSG